MIVGPFLNDLNNNLYFGGYIEYFNLPNPDSVKQYIYRFNYNQWEIAYYKLVIGIDTIYSLNNAGINIIGMTRSSFYTLNGNSFNYFLSSEFLLMGRFGGSSLNNILCLGDIDGYNSGLYSWNSNKWSNENISFNYAYYSFQGVFII